MVRDGASAGGCALDDDVSGIAAKLCVCCVSDEKRNEQKRVIN